MTSMANRALDSEIAILSALIESPTSIDEITAIITENDFYSQKHGIIFIEIMKMVTAGRQVDAVSLSDSLEPEGISLSDVARIAASLGVPDNIKSYAKVVANKSTERRLAASGEQISLISTRRDLSTDEKLDKCSAVFSAVSSESKSEVMFSKPLASSWLDKMQARMDASGELEGVATGFEKLDEMTCGFSPGDLVIVAGRPSMGKTSLALSIADEMLRDGKSVYIESIEMTHQKIMDRLVARRGMVPLKKLRQAKNLETDEWSKVTAASCSLSESKLTLHESFSPTVFDIGSRARRVQRIHGLDIVIIDYLQLMGGGNRDNETLRISDITRGLKGLANSLKVPIMLLSQLSRGVENRADKRPLMSDLRQSGSIEQDADIIIFPYRDIVYNDGTPFPHVAEFNIAKNRDGEIGMATALFEGVYAGFYNYNGEYYVNREEQKKTSRGYGG